MSKLIVTNIETQNIKYDSDTTAFTISSTGATSGVGAGAMVSLLDTTSVSGATYDISSTYINSTYDTYIIYAEFLPATDNVDMYGRVFVGGVVQTGSIHGRETHAMSSSAYHNEDAASTVARFAHGPMGNATGEGITINATLQNVNSTTRPFSITGMSNISNTSGSPNSSTFAGQLIPANAANVVNGFRFYMSSGNIASGRVRLYGIK